MTDAVAKEFPLPTARDIWKRNTPNSLRLTSTERRRLNDSDSVNKYFNSIDDDAEFYDMNDALDRLGKDIEDMGGAG